MDAVVNRSPKSHRCTMDVSCPSCDFVTQDGSICNRRRGYQDGYVVVADDRGEIGSDDRMWLDSASRRMVVLTRLGHPPAVGGKAGAYQPHNQRNLCGHRSWRT